MEHSHYGKRRPSLGRRILIGFSLGFMNLVAGLPIAITLWAVSVALGATALALILTPLVGVADYLLSGVWLPAKLFLTLVGTGLGMLLVPAVLKLGKGLIALTLRYVKWNVDMITGGSEYAY